ncbi:hypothetical protein ACSBR1_012669 [Camellia fascicularis]
MDDLYVPRGRSRCIDQEMTNSYHYFIKLFDFVIDMQLQELNNHFNEMNTELLLCVAFLNPSDSFVTFDTRKLIRFGQFYLKDFSAIELTTLPIQLENFIIDMWSSVEFSNLKGISDVARKMVKTRKERIFISWFTNCYFGTDITCCDCHNREGIFYAKDCKKQASQ